MPRIRTIKPEFWQDEKLAPMTPIDRLVFLGLISMADDAGRVLDSIRAVDGFIFSETEDTAAWSLEVLLESGRIVRGVTKSGQRVLEIVNWKHQKIDKPNLAAALPPIVLVDESSRRRRSVPPKLRDAIIDRDQGVCQLCGVELKRSKSDRYDSSPNLAEIDHILAVIDGGTNAPENLRAVCLSCNRKRAGDDVRRRNADASATDQRNVADASAPLSTTSTNDLRPNPPTPRVEPAAQLSAAPSAPGVAVVATSNGHAAALTASGIVAELRAFRDVVQAQLSGEAAETAVVRVGFAYWATSLHHEHCLLDPKRASYIRRRYRESRNPNEILYVVDGARKDDNIMGRRADSSRKYDGISTLYRDREQVERLAQLGGFTEGKVHPMAKKYLGLEEAPSS